MEPALGEGGRGREEEEKEGEDEKRGSTMKFEKICTSKMAQITTDL